MAKRKDEEFCRAEFDRFLKNLDVTANTTWMDGSEPPDYYLDVNKQRFAVEVTTLMEKIDVGRHELPTAGVNAFLLRLVAEVESDARQGNCLTGDYVVYFRGVINSAASAKAFIKRGLLDYVRRTLHLDSAPSQLVFESGLQACGIEKIKGQPDRIMMGGPMRWKWEGEAATDICTILEERVIEKVSKLQGMQMPKILLVLDRYHFADRSMFAKCLAQLATALASLHTVFVVRAARDSFVLSSQNPQWAP